VSFEFESALRMTLARCRTQQKIFLRLLSRSRHATPYSTCGFVFALALLMPSSVTAQTAVSADGQEDVSDSSQEQSGDPDDVTRPVRSFDLRYRFEDQSVTKQKDFQYLTPRLNWRLDFGPEWRVGLRLDMPIVAANQLSSSNQDGSYQVGMGRILGQAFIGHAFTDRWAAGIGGQLVSPALSGGEFGSKAWDLLPGGAVRYMLPELGSGSYFIPLLRYDISSSIDETTGRRNRNLQFAPELKIALPEMWFVELYPSPDIRINFGKAIPGQTGPLFVPIDVMVGRNLTEKTLISLEVSAPVIRDYPVYLFKIEARISTRF
jgi:hypothetical protein